MSVASASISGMSEASIGFSLAEPEPGAAEMPTIIASARVKRFAKRAKVVLAAGFPTLSRRAMRENLRYWSRGGTSLEAAVSGCIVSTVISIPVHRLVQPCPTLGSGRSFWLFRDDLDLVAVSQAHWRLQDDLIAVFNA